MIQSKEKSINTKKMDQNLAYALRNALNEVDFDAAAITVETAAVWKDPAPGNAKSMTRNKLRNFTKKKRGRSSK